MKKILLSILLLSNLLLAQTNYGNISIDEVTSIYDGDTFRVNINSYPKIIGHKMAVRLAGVDTPEIYLFFKDTLITLKKFTNLKKLTIQNFYTFEYFPNKFLLIKII